MESYSWFPRARVYKREKTRTPLEEAVNHPLKPVTVTIAESSQKNSSVRSVSDVMNSVLDGVDPLTSMLDPLSLASAQLVEEKAFQQTGPDDTFEPWSAKRSAILSKFTTSEKLTMVTSFLGASDGEQQVTRPETSVMSEKMKNRLQQLDEFEDGAVKEMLSLSQQEYTNRIEELNSALVKAWGLDQRVKALKIAIQCAKLLADTNVIQFYPSKFVLITDILENFGTLVYDRIRSKSQSMTRGGFADNLIPEQVPESAKETCRNWFYKIASIRELIPRFYVEAALMKCYSFLATGEYEEALLRLGCMTRGIGDPLVSLYARCYLCRVGVSVDPNIRAHLNICFEDFLLSYQQIEQPPVQNLLAVQQLELGHYLTLYSPALDWIMQCIAFRSSNEILSQMLERTRKLCNSALLLNAIISSFKPDFIAARALEFTNFVSTCEHAGFSKHLLYRNLGTCLMMAEPPEDQRLPILNQVWKAVSKLNVGQYVACAEVWVEFVAKYFGRKEVNTILGDIIKRVMPDRTFEDHYAQLQSVLVKILEHMHDFTALFALEKFLPFVDIFQRESVRVEVSKSILEAYLRHNDDLTRDPVLLHGLVYLCTNLHDSINALTVDDEVRTSGNLIVQVLRTITFSQDFEQQLSFYVECRANFSNLDPVLVFLVHSVNRLSMETLKLVQGNHTRKTAAFVRACAAFCFITIPSIADPFQQMSLHMLSGQVALQNLCLAQADAFFKAAVTQVQDVPNIMDVDPKGRTTVENQLLEHVSSLLSTMIIIPDRPDQDVLYLVRGLLNVLASRVWDSQQETLPVIYTQTLAMLSATAQQQLPYSITGVDSNNDLYGNDPKFLEEVATFSQTLLDQILSSLKQLDKPDKYNRLVLLALRLFNVLLAHGDMSQSATSKLAVSLWQILSRHGKHINKQLMNTYKYVKGRAGEHAQYKELLNKMPLETST